MLIANLHDDLSFDLAKIVEDGKATPAEAFEKMYVPRMIKGNVGLQFYTIGGDAPRFAGDYDLTAGTYRRLNTLWDAVEGRDDFKVILSRADLESVKRGERRGLVATMEGVLPVGDQGFATLRNFYRLGMRSICLFWFKANQVGDGINEDRQGGLTNFGKKLIKEMNRLGMLIDISQSTPQAFWDVMEVSDHPIVASHSNASAIQPHVRNLTDEQIRAMAERGGVVGISTYKAHVKKDDPTLDDLIRHIDHIVNLVGPDHVCFGLNILPGSHAENQQFFIESNIEYTGLSLPGLEDVTKLPDVAGKFEKLGYPRAAIEKITGMNIVRILEQVLH